VSKDSWREGGKNTRLPGIIRVPVVRGSRCFVSSWQETLAIVSLRDSSFSYRELGREYRYGADDGDSYWGALKIYFSKPRSQLLQRLRTFGDTLRWLGDGRRKTSLFSL